jgi:hypothetical protein
MMADKELNYEVVWEQKARLKLAEMRKFKIKLKNVFRNTKSILSVEPCEKANGIANYPGFGFYGYHWIYINNVIVVYDVLEEEKKVLVDACYSTLTGFTLQKNYGEHDTDPL